MSKTVKRILVKMCIMWISDYHRATKKKTFFPFLLFSWSKWHFCFDKYEKQNIVKVQMTTINNVDMKTNKLWCGRVNQKPVWCGDCLNDKFPLSIAIDSGGNTHGNRKTCERRKKTHSKIQKILMNPLTVFKV